MSISNYLSFCKIDHSKSQRGYFYIRRSGRGAWPQNLPLKFLLEPQILPPKICVTNTPSFALWISDMTPELELFATFVSCGDRTSQVFPPWPDFAPNFASELDVMSKAPPPPTSLFGSTPWAQNLFSNCGSDENDILSLSWCIFKSS